MENDKKRKQSSRIWYFIIFAVIILIIYKVLDNFGIITGGIKKIISVITPFISGIIIAYLFYMPCKWVERLLKKVKILNKPARFLSVVIVYLIAIALLVILINIVFPAISKSLI